MNAQDNAPQPSPMWRLLQRCSPSLLRLVKRSTSPRLRLELRQRFGADYRNIPVRLITTRDGRRFQIGPELIYWPLYLGLDFEPDATGFVKRFLRKGDTVIDVGANFGWYTTLFAALIGEQGHLLAVEPNTAAAADLRLHVRINNCPGRVDIATCALAERTGRETLFWVEGNSSGSSLVRFDPSSSPVDVACRSLDDVIGDYGLDQVRFLKCDVEGAELKVFQGGRRLLKGAAAPVILFEINPGRCRAFGHRPGDLFDELRSDGYRHFFAMNSPLEIKRLKIQSGGPWPADVIASKDDIVETRFSESGGRVL